MKKSDLISEMKERNDSLTEEQCSKIIDAVFNSVFSALSDGKRVEVRGFGAFLTKLKPARTGRNPRTGEPVNIDEKRFIYFKYGKDLKEAVNAA